VIRDLSDNGDRWLESRSVMLDLRWKIQLLFEMRRFGAETRPFQGGVNPQGHCDKKYNQRSF